MYVVTGLIYGHDLPILHMFSSPAIAPPAANQIDYSYMEITGAVKLRLATRDNPPFPDNVTKDSPVSGIQTS